MSSRQLTGIPDSAGARIVRRGRALGRFDQFFFASGRLAHPVYYGGDPEAPPVLLLPEIAGFSPGLRLFAERLIDVRFRIFVPWLFGPLGVRAPLRNGIRLCVSREFANLRAGVSSPISTWLRALTAHVSEHSGGRQVGAIGMCLTGAFAIPLIIDPQVVAAVAAQPAVPLAPLFMALGIAGERQSSQLNVSDSEIAQARKRLEAGRAHLLSVRCRSDRICPRAKIERLRREFPVGLEIREYAAAGERNCLGERPHATFTREYRIAPGASAEHYSRRAFADLVAFLDRHLRK
ncbi:MAG TPA: dienelactone hydrolase family protein [Steroidobacteraceae bacterium]|nr:dienelactone hydrolase family protein [Steroidobacteraceae bacterium]